MSNSLWPHGLEHARLLCFPISPRVSSNSCSLNQWCYLTITSNEYLGSISFRIDWFDFLSVQRTLKSLLQHHYLKASILWHPAFFMVQITHLYMTIGKINTYHICHYFLFFGHVLIPVFVFHTFFFFCSLNWAF